MLTVFSIPKAFAGHFGVIQRNALRSWCALGPNCQVIVCGDERGAEQAATEFGADWIPKIDRNEFGVSWNAPLPDGGFLLPDRVDLSASFSAVKAV